MQQEFYERRKEEARSENEIIAVLNAGKPNEIKDEIWVKLSAELRKNLIDNLEYKMYLTNTPYSYLQNLDLSCLENESQIRLKKHAYRMQFENYNSAITVEEAKTFLSLPKPEWLKEGEYLILKSRAEKIIEIEESMFDFEEKLKEQKSLTDEVIKEYHQKIESLSIDRKKIDIQWEEVSKLRQKIETQLEVINAVINEPEKIERIEDYSHSFAPGNFENLKKLVELEKANSAEL